MYWICAYRQAPVGDLIYTVEVQNCIEESDYRKELRLLQAVGVVMGALGRV